jgi:hypothetical protein
MREKLGKWLLMAVWGLTAVFLAACGADDEVANTAVPGEPTLNPTQEAIAAVLTYQAENPRATRTIDGWVWFVRTATAEAHYFETATAEAMGLTPTLNPTQEAIAAVLTYQAENPRPTRERWQGANLALTAQAENRQTPTIAPTLAPTATPTPTSTPQPRLADVIIPAGTAPQLDGRFTDGEWDDAGQQTIQTGAGVQVQAFYKHDAANLYVAFDGLDQGSTALFPELLLDTGFDSQSAWNEDDYWFHVSTNLCQGSGAAALWQQCGAPNGWLATDFSQSLSIIEMQIPYATVNLRPGTDQPIALGWAVMQLTTADEEVRAFWPSTAVLAQPATWAKGTAVGGW